MKHVVFFFRDLQNNLNEGKALFSQQGEVSNQLLKIFGALA